MKRKVAICLGLAALLQAAPAFADYKPGDPIPLGHVHKAYGEDDNDTGSDPSSPASPAAQSADIKQSSSKHKAGKSKSSYAKPKSSYVTPKSTDTSSSTATSPQSSPPVQASSAAPSTTDPQQPAPTTATAADQTTTATGAQEHHPSVNLKHAFRAIGAAAGYIFNPVGSAVNAATSAAGGQSSASTAAAPTSTGDVVTGVEPNHPTGPAIARSSSQNMDPDGSLNFSSPPRARGPFNQNTATSIYRSKNWESLLDYSRGWAAAEPRNEIAWFLLGDAAIHLGNYDAAVYGFKHSVEIKSDEPKAWNNLSAAYCKRQQWNLAGKAIADGEKASNALCGATDWYVFGNARKELKDYSGAVVDYQRALAMRPNFPEATNNLGVCQHEMGDSGAAMANYSKAASQGDQAAKNNKTNMQQEAAAQRAAAQRRSSGVSNNPYDAAAKARALDRADVIRRTDMNGNIAPRQY